MSNYVKTQLKSAKEAIQSKNFEYAKQVCQDVLEGDKTNYNALVFLGLASKELGELKEAQNAYENVDFIINLGNCFQSFVGIGLSRIVEIARILKRFETAASVTWFDVSIVQGIAR